jgi:hypothetical protein
VSDFVPDGFVVPMGLATEQFRLEPLGPEHNERDYAAWMSSIEHIRATPGFAGRNWPDPEMSLEQNLGDLERHAEDFARREGFTYTVLAGDPGDPGDQGNQGEQGDQADEGNEVVGCVYIYPSREPGYDAQVRSWVRAADGELDGPLRRAVGHWLDTAWPFRAVSYDRDGT